MKKQNSSRIVPAMHRTLILLALIVLGALPVYAQTHANEVGFLVGGSRRFIEGATSATGEPFEEGNFSFSNNVVELFWNMRLDRDTYLKFKGGRIESPVAFAVEQPGNDATFRQDVDGEVQHVSALVEYRFREILGNSGIYGGAGLYRQTAPGFESTTNVGFSVGVMGDFPLTQRYGVVVDAAYHWPRGDFRPRYLTLSGGLRIGF